MRYRYLMVAIILIFTACGSGNGANSIVMPQEELKQNTGFKHSQKVVTIYVHGFKPDGYYRDGVYGAEYISDFTERLSEYTKYPMLDSYDRDNYSNIITGVEYYGDKAPNYYTQKDIDAVESVENGIPRYALIVAKYAKLMLDKTGAERVNIISASMGSLITRYMIEKDIEGLASNRKIEQWITTEGVIRGNYVASRIKNIENSAIKDTVDAFFAKSPEAKQMKYEWIEANLIMERDTMKSPYYNDILVSQISLTNADKDDGLGLRYVLPTHGGFQPNDGFQLVKDTYFGKIENYIQVPSHTLIHIDHVSINDSSSIYSIVSADLEAKKRVRVTLIDATVNSLHERITPKINENAEVVFANSIYSPKAQERWGVDGLISQRVYDGGTLPIHHYKKRGEKKEFKQILFDDFVLEDESKLQVAIEAFEIDRSTKYNISEASTKSKETLSRSQISIDLEDGIYNIISDEWSGHIRVEVLEM